MQQPLRIYVAGPYSGATPEEIQQNVDHAVDAGLAIFRKGHHPYVPHLTHLVDRRARETNNPMSWDDFMQWDAPWLEASDALLLLGHSRGADIELEQTRRLGLAILHCLEEIPPVEKPRTKSQVIREVMAQRGTAVEDAKIPRETPDKERSRK